LIALARHLKAWLPGLLLGVLASSGLVLGLLSVILATTPTPVTASATADRPDFAARARVLAEADAAPAATGPAADGTTTVSVPAPAPSVPVAWLTIPALHLNNVAIYERGLDSRRNMLIAPGFAVTHYSFSGALGAGSNAVLYGHDDIEGGVFGHILSLGVGDLITVRTADSTLTYRVSEKPRLVRPDAVSILDPTTTPRLTLFSCWPLWVDNQRSVVVATQV
jgi:LPXTG-site transpeptidase (sortase) family protein